MTSSRPVASGVYEIVEPCSSWRVGDRLVESVADVALHNPATFDTWRESLTGRSSHGDGWDAGAADASSDLSRAVAEGLVHSSLAADPEADC